MVFDDKYFTSVDTSSYFTVSEKEKIYDAASGIQLGESFSPANTPLQGAQLAANHGLPTFMISAWEPAGGEKGGGGHGTAVDRISQLQEKAIGEVIAVNNMNFAMHAPIVDIMGLDSRQQGGVLSSEKKRENLNLLKFNIDQADRIADTAKLKNTPVNIHTTNGIGSVGHKFDSGYRTKEGEVVWGTHNAMVDRDSGRFFPIDSKFQYMNINEGNSFGYNKVDGTETSDGVMALYEITPEKAIIMQNNTALNEERKKIADAQIRIKQLQDAKTDPSDPVFEDLNTTIRTAQAQISHLEAPAYGTGTMKNQFVSVVDYSNVVVPKQIAELAMHSLKKTKTNPVIAVENEPGFQLGSNPTILVDWVDRARKEFSNRLVKDEGYDRSSAEDKAKELIGLTLDTGHLNTLKSQINPDTNKPWTDEELKKMAEKMAKTGAKLVHIADNIGELGQDTHLMIGRGNVQNAEFLKILKENGFKGQAQFEAFTQETAFDKLGAQANLMGLGAPMYSSTPAPRFTEVGSDFSSSYSLRNANYGHMMSPLHWSQWGGPFAGLQSTFGAGGGQQKDQFSGTPTE
ncbi:MAG: sugar phosphate isomerase/epimerase [Nanoarchaeota archaeon]|nr:sugar phosphate isomerase/epimerase [Nanoarchaeota archaeon]